MLRYAITDRARFSAESGQQAEPHCQAALLAHAARLAADGIDFLQLREKDLSAAALTSLARNLLATLRADRTRPAPKLLINSRADIAIATHADGIHLTSSPNELTPAQIRTLYAAASLPEPVISLSCHTLAEVARAASSVPNERPTLILFGPVFEKVVRETVVAMNSPSITNCHSDPEHSEGEESPHFSGCATASPGGENAVEEASERPISDKKITAGTGLDLLRAACLAAAPIPVLALGGITPANAASTLAAGAAGVAAIRFFLSESAQIPPESSH
jgi:thiamine-phosphate pyrophosphorylase